MNDLLLINASPRREASESLRIAEALVEAIRGVEPALAVDRLDLFEDPPPAFGAAAALRQDGRDRRARGAGRAPARVGAGAGDRRAAARGTALGARGADVELRAAVALKQLIDTVTQPGVAFDFDPAAGYRGLLGGRRAVPIYTSQVYSPGVPPAFGVDHHSTYLGWWFQFVGVEQVGEIRLQPTFADDTLPARRDAALEQARALGRRLAATAGGIAA